MSCLIIIIVLFIVCCVHHLYSLFSQRNQEVTKMQLILPFSVRSVSVILTGIASAKDFQREKLSAATMWLQSESTSNHR